LSPRHVLALAIAVIVFSGYFFVLAVDLMARSPPKVAAALLAALIGFALVSAATSMVKAAVAASSRA
jgi:hypothetical protein